jgi:inhibitor of cysteine peptidase
MKNNRKWQVSKYKAFFILTVLLLSVSLLFTACTNEESASITPTATDVPLTTLEPTPITTLGSVQTQVGQEFTLTLDSNQTTGYNWQLAEPLDGDYIELADYEYEVPETSPGLVGVGGEELWTFRTIAEGDIEVSLEYCQPWDREASLAEVRTYVVHIGPIEADVGDEFTITVASNPTTGYEWQLAQPLVGGVLLFVTSEYEPDETDTEIEGAGGKEVWSFEAEGLGDTTVFMKYVRSWEGNATPADQRSFNIIVNSAEVNVGDEFTITLDSNATTGYEWQLADTLDESILELVGSEYTIPNDEGLVGAGGIEVWTFKAAGFGETDVSMEYVRPWEEDGTPAKERTFSITVK